MLTTTVYFSPQNNFQKVYIYFCQLCSCCLYFWATKLIFGRVVRSSLQRASQEFWKISTLLPLLNLMYEPYKPKIRYDLTCKWGTYFWVILATFNLHRASFYHIIIKFHVLTLCYVPDISISFHILIGSICNTTIYHEIMYDWLDQQTKLK